MFQTGIGKYHLTCIDMKVSFVFVVCNLKTIYLSTAIYYISL